MCLFLGNPLSFGAAEAPQRCPRARPLICARPESTTEAPCLSTAEVSEASPNPKTRPWLARRPPAEEQAIWMMKWHLIKNHGKNLGCDTYQLSNTYKMFGHLIKDLCTEKSCAVRLQMAWECLIFPRCHTIHNTGVVSMELPSPWNSLKFITCVCPNRVPS